MPRPSIPSHRRRVLTLRHREHAWKKAEAVLFDADGPGLFYGLCLAREGVGTEAEVLAQFERTSRRLLAVMREARPEEASLLHRRWEAWFAKWQRS
ncbi:MAG TPA: hypothetical protein DFR83_01315 [Deltaproteobacteria bacterium]|nr:hypothetical protein [Deltaproteobacteria bacterium]